MSAIVAGWTEARYRSFITSAIRGGFGRFPNKYTVLKNAYTSTKINPASGRLAKHYKCKKCGGEFVGAKVQVDHIKPIVDVKKGFTDWDTFIKNLYCGVRNLQVLCIPCHKAKTAKERKTTNEYRKKRAV